jgi:hypothetical protein
LDRTETSSVFLAIVSLVTYYGPRTEVVD